MITRETLKDRDDRVAHEWRTFKTLRGLALTHTVLLSDSVEEARRKRKLGLCVEADPQDVVDNLRLRFSGYRNEEKRRDLGRVYVLERDPTAAFAIATLEVHAVGSYTGATFEHSMREASRLELTSGDLIDAMRRYAMGELTGTPEEGTSTHQFLDTLDDIEVRRRMTLAPTS